MKYLILLFILGVALFFYRQYRLEGSISTVRFAEDQRSLQGFKTSPLLAKEKITGTFIARSDHLGGLLLRFENFQKISTDSVNFSLKELDSSQWYYQSKVKVDQFQPRELFPFGFPLINNSSGKKYYFEVESLDGKPGNAIAISPLYPVYMTLYQYPKKETLSAVFPVLKFIYIKLYSLFSNYLTLNLLLVSFSPFIIFSLIKKKFIVPITVCAYLFLVTQSGDIYITSVISVLLISCFLFFSTQTDINPESFLPPLLVLYIATSVHYGQIPLAQNYVSWLFIFILIIMVKYMVSLLRPE